MTTLLALSSVPGATVTTGTPLTRATMGGSEAAPGVHYHAVGDAGVPAIGAPAAASQKATIGLRVLSAPWPTTLCVSLATRRTDTRSPPSS